MPWPSISRRSVALAAEVTPEVTFLGAHVVPPEFAADRGGYLDLVCGPMLAACAAQAQGSKATTAPAPKATASACKGLDQTACGANTACQWIAPKSGKQKPYCRTKPKGKTAAPKQAPGTK